MQPFSVEPHITQFRLYRKELPQKIFSVTQNSASWHSTVRYITVFVHRKISSDEHITEASLV
jgi:hypothetical protein